MCVRVRFTAQLCRSIYSPDSRLITIPASIADSRRVTAVRAVLSELRVPQPELGAVCWCGEPIEILRDPSSEGTDK